METMFSRRAKLVCLPQTGGGYKLDGRVLKKVKLAYVVCAILGCAGGVSAKTLALWPVEYRTATGSVDGRCAIDARNDFTIFNPAEKNVSTASGGIGWHLPPNPDMTDGMLFEPRNMTYVCATTNRASYLANGTAGQHLAPTNSFTLEGFIRLKSLPLNGKWWVLTQMGEYTANRLLFTIRNNHGACTTTSHPDAETQYSWQIVSAGHSSNGRDQLLKVFTQAEVTAITNGWHHWALTYEFVKGGTCTYSLWLDGEKKGEFSDTLKPNFSMVNNKLELGGRDSAQQTIDGAIDYVRISDCVLQPSEFLNAGDAGALAYNAKDRVKCYWKLGKSASGEIDGTPTIGKMNFCGALFGSTNNTGKMIFPEPECAFVGNPPNPTVSLPDGNAGSFASRVNNVNSSLYVAELGKLLTLTNDFTVEGWIRPERRNSDIPVNYEHICGTRLSGAVGWIFQIYVKDAQATLCLHTQDKTGKLFTEVNFGDLSGWEDEWHHVALSYDADGGPNGFGLWTCYIDGEVSGTHENTRAVDGDTVYHDNFKIFTMTSEAQVFHGKLDCWRVCSTVLTADQLMCRENGSAATGVLALWPMNEIGGAYMDGRDVVGTYHIEETPREAYRRAVATDDTPPQAGVPAGNGSVGFRGFGGNNSYLQTLDPAMAGALTGADGFTFETWMKLTVDQVSAWNVIFMFGGVQTSPTGYGAHLNFSYRTNGFVLYFITGGINDVPFHDEEGNSIFLEKDVWTHVALCFHGSSTNLWDLYTNGVKCASISSPTQKLPDGTTMQLGGRSSTANSFQGKMACVRVSSGVLNPSDFLCAQTNCAPQTVAFWPIDYQNGALDLEDRLPTPWRLLATGSVVGSSDRARVSVPRPDTSASFIGNPSANVGSAVLDASASLYAGTVGDYVDVHDPFTVEGWVRWNKEAGSAQETICGTWSGTCGWRLMVDSTGESPTFRIQAKGGNVMTKLIDTAFATEAAAALDTGWHHLALTYDPARAYGRGVWSLYVDGQAAGEAENWWAPSGLFLADWTHNFRLGSVTGNAGETSLIGGFDLWRVSTGVRVPNEFLYAPPSGTVILFR